MSLFDLATSAGCGWVTSRPLAYDDACHLTRYATNRKAAPQFGKVMSDWLGNLCRLDRFHAGNHVDPWCKANVSLGKSAVVMWGDLAKH